MEFARQLATIARGLHDEVRTALPQSWWGRLRDRLQQGLKWTTSRPASEDELAQTVVQSVVCSLVSVQHLRRFMDDPTVHRMLRGCGPLVQMSLTTCLETDGLDATCPESVVRVADCVREAFRAGHLSLGDDLLHFYEQFLNSADASTRQRHGVYYTPRPIARNIVARIDQLLRDEFQWKDGLADHASVARILDPAAGTGVFLIEAIARIHHTRARQWRDQGADDIAIQQRWNQYVPTHLLPRVAGLELMLPAAILATIQIAVKLAVTGYEFETDARLPVYVTDTLAGPHAPSFLDGPPESWKAEMRAIQRVAYGSPATVLLGNPPFSGISQNKSVWIDRLLKGRTSDGDGYYHVDGEPLGERKVWLQDDYVKFLRYAHWHLERAGCGIIGFITNHGYLDNASFRGMRQHLVRSFPRITIIDLHGNRKKGESTPTGSVDENVFGIEQGVAISLLRKTPGPIAEEVRHQDVWGTREAKIETLESQAETHAGQRLSPTSPHFLFRPRATIPCNAYDRALSLTEAMPVRSTAAVTARDGFVVAFEPPELLDRIRQFRDLRIPSSELRAQFFTNSRSREYAPGDTRGWKLEQARKVVAEDENWHQHVRPFSYRPFDRRVIYWTKDMVDWPRSEVMRHMIEIDNLALITRRQMVPNQPCNFFWVANSIVLDGVIRSDNRGSESFFPLFLKESLTTQRARGDPRNVSANFSDAFLSRVEQATGSQWDSTGAMGDTDRFGPVDLFAYIYALFHSSNYRRRYAHELEVDFPRVLLPSTGTLFRRMSHIGRQLIHLHIHAPNEGTSGSLNSAEPPSSGLPKPKPIHVGTRYPQFAGGEVRIDQETVVAETSHEVWTFQVGSHQVCRKWLKDRRGRCLSPAVISEFRQILPRIQETLRCTQEIDRQIIQSGDWRGAFQG